MRPREALAVVAACGAAAAGCGSSPAAQPAAARNGTGDSVYARLQGFTGSDRQQPYDELLRSAPNAG